MDPLCWRIFVKNTVFTTFLLKIVMKQIITFLVYILNIFFYQTPFNLRGTDFGSNRWLMEERMRVMGDCGMTGKE